MDGVSEVGFAESCESGSGGVLSSMLLIHISRAGTAMAAYLACSDDSGDEQYQHPPLLEFDWAIQIRSTPTSLMAPPGFYDDSGPSGQGHIADGAFTGAGPSNSNPSGH